VTQIVGSYELRREAAAGVDAYPESPDDFVMVRGGIGVVDRPTITYEPINGEMLTKVLLAPVPPDAVMNLVRAGYRADRLLMLYLRSINGRHNPFIDEAAPTVGDGSVSIFTVSMLQTMGRLSRGVEVPPEHVALGLVPASQPLSSSPSDPRSSSRAAGRGRPCAGLGALSGLRVLAGSRRLRIEGHLLQHLGAVAPHPGRGAGPGAGADDTRRGDGNFRLTSSPCWLSRGSYLLSRARSATAAPNTATPRRVSGKSVSMTRVSSGIKDSSTTPDAVGCVAARSGLRGAMVPKTASTSFQGLPLRRAKTSVRAASCRRHP
jgi:hypothetical protein